MNKKIILIIICLLLGCTGKVQITLPKTASMPVPQIIVSSSPSPVQTPTFKSQLPSPPSPPQPVPTPAPSPSPSDSPFIELINPDTADQSQYITITGKNFIDKGRLTFISKSGNFVDIETKFWSNEKIVFMIPGTVSGNSSYDVSVRVNKNKSNTKKFIVLGTTTLGGGGGGGGSGGGGGGGGSTFNPVPSISTLTPVQASVSGTGFTLTVDGANFVTDSIVKFNETPLVTTYVNSNQLTATVTATELSNIGIMTVKIFNPPPGGGDSNIIDFNILDLRSTITSFSPIFSNPTSTSLILTVNGTNFTPSSIVNFGENNLVTSYVNDKKLTCTIPAGQLNKPDSKTVKIIDSSMGTSISSYFGVIGIIKEISLPNGAGVAINPNTNMAVITEGTDSEANPITLFDLNTNSVVKELQMDMFFRNVAINPDTNMAVVVPNGTGMDDTIKLVDLTKKQVIASISVGCFCDWGGGGVAINTKNNTALVCVTGDKTVAIVDLNTKQVTKKIDIDVGEPFDIAFNSQNDKVLISYSDGNNEDIGLLDITNGKYESLTIIDNTWNARFALIPDTDKAVISSGNTNSPYVRVLDITTKQSYDIDLSTDKPKGVAIIPQKNLAAVSCQGNNMSAVEVVDPIAGRVITTIEIGMGVVRIAVNPNTGTAVVTTRSDGPGAFIVQLP